MGTEGGFRITPRVILGVFVMLLGVLFTLDTLDILEIEPYWRFWPLVLVTIGLAKMLQSKGSPGRGTGALFVILGAWLQLDQFDIVDFNLMVFWPLILVAVGFSMVLQGARRRSPESRDRDPSSRLSAFAVLGGVNRKSSATDFRGAEATAILGGCDLDLSQASIASGEAAVIDTFAVWGGIDIKVPQDWTVVVTGVPLMGAFVDSRKEPRPDPTKRLIVRGLAFMGGVEIKS